VPSLRRLRGRCERAIISRQRFATSNRPKFLWAAVRDAGVTHFATGSYLFEVTASKLLRLGNYPASRLGTIGAFWETLWSAGPFGPTAGRSM
jgi:hypothetical protein